jgi:predicted nucleic acid-binding protein
MIFCDTSTVAKLYVPEVESRAVRERLESENAVHVSELVRVELAAVFHRRLREHSWSQTQFLTATRQFASDELGGFWTWLTLDTLVINAAATMFRTLPESVFLRSADSLHLATAIRHNFSEVYTHDRHQTHAASALGLRAIAIG